jgi:hypothetical protein
MFGDQINIVYTKKLDYVLVRNKPQSRKKGQNKIGLKRGTNSKKVVKQLRNIMGC